MKTYLIHLVMSIFAVIAPLQETVLAMGFIIFADMVMGIIASLKIGEKITSKKLRLTATKMVVYNILLLVSFITEKYMVSWVPFTRICLAFLGITEIYSIGESFQNITGLSFINYLKIQINKFVKIK